MTKKFINLPNKYKNLLNEIKLIFTREILENLAKNEISYQNLLDLHNKIEDICNSNDCNSYDINKMINYYEKKNSIIDILKKIASLRNKYIVLHAQKSEFWNKNLNDIKLKIKKNKGKDIEIDIIEKYYIKILKKYKYNWDGLWSTIEINNKGNIKNVNLFDIDDYNELIELLIDN